jgi:hypothetical protein
VEKPPDLSKTVELRALFLKAPDPEHLPQQLEAMVTIYNGIHLFSIQHRAVSYQRSAFSELSLRG